MFKKVAIKIAKILKIPLNYSGLRIETIELIKNFDKTHSNIYFCSEKKKTFILFFGDSNIFGWNYLYKDSIPAILEQNLKTSRSSKRQIVINFGIGGAKLSDMNKNFLNYFRNENDLIVILSYGLNDGLLNNILKNYFVKNMSDYRWEEFSEKILEFEYNKFLKNYLKIINVLLKKNIKVILMGLYKIGKTKIDKKWINEKYYLKMQNSILCSLNAKIKEVATKTGTNFVDLWNIFESKKMNESYLQKDMLHLNRKAYEVICKKIEFVLKKQIKS